MNRLKLSQLSTPYLTVLSSQSRDQRKPTICHIIFASQPLHPGDATVRDRSANSFQGVVITITVWCGVWPPLPCDSH